MTLVIGHSSSFSAEPAPTVRGCGCNQAGSPCWRPCPLCSPAHSRCAPFCFPSWFRGTPLKPPNPLTNNNNNKAKRKQMQSTPRQPCVPTAGPQHGPLPTGERGGGRAALLPGVVHGLSSAQCLGWLPFHLDSAAGGRWMAGRLSVCQQFGLAAKRPCWPCSREAAWLPQVPRCRLSGAVQAHGSSEEADTQRSFVVSAFPGTV